MKSKNLASLLRAVAGIALLGVLLAWVGIEPMRQTLAHFIPVYYAVAVALLFTHFFLQSVLIRILLERKGIQVRALHVFRLTIISQFFGVFLPGGIGPDVVLCYNMVRSTEKKEVALSAIVFIRIAILFIMSLMAFACSFHPRVARVELQIVTGGVLAAFAVYAFIMANRNSLSVARRLLEVLNRHHVTAILYKAYFALADYGRDRHGLLRIAPYLLGSALCKIVTDYFIARSLGFDIPLYYFFLFIPLITVISAVPLTFAGLGVREGSFAGLFALVGVPAEQAIAVSLVSFTLIILMAIVGAGLYIVHGASLVTRNETGTDQQGNSVG